MSAGCGGSDRITGGGPIGHSPDISPDISAPIAQESVPLGSSSNFAILASGAITTIATSAITGDVGLTPDAGSNISGFSVPETCPEVTGDMYAVDATGPACALIDPVLLMNAKNDSESAFINARAAVRGTPVSVSGNLNGLTLYPGLYESGTSLEISPGGSLYLDAEGDVNAIFIIRSATSITTEDTSEVVLTHGAKASNVTWTAGSTVTLGTNSIMKGTLISGSSISLLTGANLEGRALNQGAAAEAITLDSSTITVPSP
ncbi:MAG: ice-binding family protein [bacterium]|nr:ice-binding family protein [bacterium]